MESCAVTAEVTWLTLRNVVNPVTWSGLPTGTDGNIYTAKAGILVNNIQPFAHDELLSPDASASDDTTVYGVGCNYYIKGQANKLTLEYASVDDDNDISVDIITVQAAFWF